MAREAITDDDRERIQKFLSKSPMTRDPDDLLPDEELLSDDGD
jgi:hypothetical protein